MSCRPHDEPEALRVPAGRCCVCGDAFAPGTVAYVIGNNHYCLRCMPRVRAKWPDDSKVELPRGPGRVFAALLLLGVLLAVAALIVVHACGGFGDLWSTGGAR